MRQITLITAPTIIPLASMSIEPGSLEQLHAWLSTTNPACVEGAQDAWSAIFPHNGYDPEHPSSACSPNELLVELAGRKCYNSFGAKAGRKTNAEYIANLFGAPGKIPHASVLYHAKMSFFVAGIGRRVSHELIRHYVGADREEEGSPSQESTRYTHHNGHFSVHPRDLEIAGGIAAFRYDMQNAYDTYINYLDDQIAIYCRTHGRDPSGLDRKRIYEAAAQRLPGAACTSFVWTTNPMALDKLFTERCDDASDLEMQRLAKAWRKIAYAWHPNLFRGSNPALQVNV